MNITFKQQFGIWRNCTRKFGGEMVVILGQWFKVFTRTETYSMINLR